MKQGTGDFIHIEQLKILARVGVSKAERAKPQRLALSISIWPRLETEDLSDDVSKTVDYFEVCQEAKKFVQKRPDRLIETLAGAVADHLLRKFSIQRVTVELRKFVLKDTDYVSITVERAAALG
jgi:FolB domain-containing protein